MTSPEYHQDVDLFRDAISFTESETGFSGRLVEKDYYCSLVLEDLSSAMGRRLAFKGGTSLSKVHGDFYRLSEDLDFGVSTPVDASRTERSKRVAALKEHWEELPNRVPCFRLVDALKGYNNSTQYIGSVCYRSVLTGEDEPIKVEISVGEPIVDAVRELPARTLLVDPFQGNAAVGPFPLAVLSREEAYAEKLRAALTRRDPAVRDFYDVDHAIRAGWVDPKSSRLVELVRQKLAVPGNDAVDISGGKLDNLRRQIEHRLKPVLREIDLAEFDVDRAFETVRRFAEKFVA